MSETYHVVLLVEQALTAADAAQIRSRHEGLDDEVVHHVLFPSEDAAARIESAVSTLGSDSITGVRSPRPNPETIEFVVDETARRTREDLQATLEAMHSAGAKAEGEVTDDDPIQALAATVQAIDGCEAIILTRPHTVSEFFHRDWSSRARRTIGVPVLHLLEHENFDERAGSGEGVTGL